MKKIAMIAVVAVIAIFAFFYVQIQKLEKDVTAKLAQHETTFQQFNVGIFPQPYISFDQVKHNQIRIEKLTGKFPLSAVFFGEVKLQDVEIQNLRLSEKAKNAANIHMRFSDFSLERIADRNVTFSGENVISVELEKPLYGNNKVFNFAFVTGDIGQTEGKKFAAVFDQATLNNQPLGHIQAVLDLSQFTKHVTAEVNSHCQPQCRAHLDYVSEPAQSAVIFSGENYPLERVVSLLNFPNTITGDTDFSILMHFADSQIIEGKFSFEARNGELLGLNLLDLAGQYLPINWNATELKERGGITTKYQEVISRFALNGHKLDIEKMSLKTTALLGEGAGSVDLQTMQCDIDLNLRATDAKYADIVLPIRFFDSCYSPQYELKITKDFRKRVKELIKQKLK